MGRGNAISGSAERVFLSWATCMGSWVSATILTCPPVSDYHKAAQGLGAQGLLLSRENEDQVVKVLRDAQQWCQDGHPVVVNILIGRTDFRDGSIAM